MEKKVSIELNTKAQQVAEMFSKVRGGNVANETFTVDRVEVLSEKTACVVFHKEPTKKQAVAWFYYIRSRANPRWEYFFVTYDHLMGLRRVYDVLSEVETHNFKANNE